MTGCYCGEDSLWTIGWGNWGCIGDWGWLDVKAGHPSADLLPQFKVELLLLKFLFGSIGHTHQYDHNYLLCAQMCSMAVL